MTSFVLGVIVGAGMFWLAERWRSWKGDEPGKMDKGPTKRAK